MTQNFADFYESNLELLKKNHPSTFRQVQNHTPVPVGEIKHTPDGHPNLYAENPQKRTIRFHNELTPEKESEDFLKKVPESAKGFVAIVGLGLFYPALKILEKRPQLQYLGLFELEIDFFIQALRHIDLSSILKDPRAILCIGPNPEFQAVLKPAFQTLQLEHSQILHHKPSFDYNPEGYNQLKDNLYTHINGLNIGGETIRKLGKDFLTNRFQNMMTIHHHLLLEHIGNKLAGKPAILVAGGPSLDKNIHLLKQVQEKAVIFAVDTVLPSLMENGVYPHFLTSIDPNNLTYEKFADAVPKVKDTTLICASWVNPKTPKVFPAEKVLWTFSSKSMEAWLNSLVGGKKLTAGASTVAHLNLAAAHTLGCNPIIFVGQDLAYPNKTKTSHASGTVLQGTAPANTSPLVQGQTVIGINGETLQTNRSFLSMKKFFENAISGSDKIHINSTEGGANIEGTQVLPLQESIDTYCSTPINVASELKSFFHKVEPITLDKALEEFSGLLSKIKQLQLKVTKSNKIKNLLLKEIQKIKKKGKPVKSFDMLSKSQKNQINKLDSVHKGIDAEVRVWSLLEEITMEGLKESKRQKQEISRLENNPEKYIEWLTKNLERLLRINDVRQGTLALLSENLETIIAFHAKESDLLKKIHSAPDDKDHMLNIARLYIDFKNYYLAKHWLEKLCTISPDSGEVYFHLGCISARSDMTPEAERYFQKALEYDPELENQINQYRKEIGEEFLEFARYFKSMPNREASIRYMILKGLKYDPDRTELKKELENTLTRNLEKIKSDLDTANYENTTLLISQWHQHITEHEKAFKSIPADLIGRIFLYQARLQLSQKNYTNALSNLNNALNYAPKNHDIHHTLIDTLFVTNDFNGAITALNNAVKIDKHFAAYWETIGDSLQSAEQYDDALIAYENCFTNLPDNIRILKKIGDCYLATDRLEAAKAAYEQLQSLMNSPDA